MNASFRAAIARVFTEVRAESSLLVFVGVYGCCKTVFFFLTGSVGLLTPSGSVHLGVAALGVFLVGLRLLLIFVVPGLLGYRLARAAWRKLGAERDAAEPRR